MSISTNNNKIQGDEEGGVLTASVNDMGWYGCYPEDCEEMMSAPLIFEATINLIRKMHVDPMVAHYKLHLYAAFCY